MADASVREASDLDATLAGSHFQIDVMQFGAKGDGVTDDSGALLAAHNAAVAGGSFLPVVHLPAGTYHAPCLANVANALFVGDGVITGAYRKRSFLPHTPAPPAPGATIHPSIHLPRFSVATAPVVAIIGDSTSTNAHQVSDGDNLWPLLCRQIARHNPGKAITFLNFAIGASRWKEADGTPTTNLPTWYSPTATPWLNFVRTAAPDLLIFNFGMNDGEAGGVGSSWLSAFRSVIAKVRAWAKAPDIIFIVNRVPTLMEPGWQTQIEQDGRDSIAQYQRTYAIKHGYGHIDLNRRFNIVRDGFDVCDTAIRNVIGSACVTLGSYTWPQATRDLAVKFIYRGAGAAYWAEITSLTLQIGSRPGNALIITQDRGSGNLAVQVNADTDFVCVPLTVSSVSANAAAQLTEHYGWSYFSIAVKSERLFASYNGNVIFDGEVERFGGLFTPVLMAAGIANTVVMQTVGVGVEAAYMPSITDRALYGTVDGLYPFGGNGINHGSSLCSQFVEAPVIEAQNFASTTMEAAHKPRVTRWNLAAGSAPPSVRCHDAASRAAGGAVPGGDRAAALSSPNV